MNHNTQHSLAIVLRLAMVLITLFTTLQIASAQGPPADTSLTTNEIATPNLSGTADSVPGARFVHVSTAANISSNWTYIDHYLTNENPNAIVFATQNWNPGDVEGAHNNHRIGVWYHAAAKKWAVFNQDLAAMTTNAAFNILVPDTSANVFVHEATITNTFTYWTYIDHPLTNGNPNAVVLVTQNYNPGGVGGTYNDHSVAVWYDSFEEKWGIFNQDFVNLAIGTAFNVLVSSSGTSAFIHEAMAAGVDTYIDHPLTNNNPYALVFVTQAWGDWLHIYNDHPLSVWYDDWEGKWVIYSNDLTTMPAGMIFNVVVPTTGTAYFVHEATAGNITYDYTSIDHPLTNGNPNAILFATQNWNGGLGGGTGTHAIGVWYDDIEGKWAIFNQNQAAMPVHTAFDVLIPNVDTGVFVHRATAENTILHLTSIDHPLTNNNPDAIVFVTPNWNPGGVGGTYNDHATGVYYNSTAQKWTIFNQDLALMPIDATFNVMVPLSDTTVFVHKATAGNTTAFVTLIDHPLTNDNPNAVVLVTQNYNPGGVGGTYNAHPIVTGYDNTARKWAILNTDHAAMPVGAAFNVMVKMHEVYLPLVMH